MTNRQINSNTDSVIRSRPDKSTCESDTNDDASKRHDLVEAVRAIESTIGKCEKALLKLREGSSQHTLTKRRIAAFRIAVGLIEREIEKTSM
jgi:hypothetical protein